VEREDGFGHAECFAPAIARGGAAAGQVGRIVEVAISGLEGDMLIGEAL
jgi:hypothetical protein